MDDLKCFYVEQCVINELNNDLNDKFKTEKKLLPETKGLIHKYFGLTISYQEKHQVVFTMYDYLEDILDETPRDMNGAKTRTLAKIENGR